MSDQGNYRYDVFISYNHVDRDWVWNELLPRLEQAGLHVCIDYRDFVAGTPILINIERAAGESRHTLAVLTPEWIDSEWTELESLLVGVTDPAGRHQRLLPLRLKSCTLPPRIAMLTHVDFVQPPPHVDPFDRLLSQLRNSVAPSRPLIQPDSSPIQNAAIIGPQQGKVKNPQDAIVLVTSEDQTIANWGTAFVIHSQERCTYLLTCAHVVKDVGGDEKVKVGADHATVVANGLEEYGIDIAVLRVDKNLDRQALRLSRTAKSGNAFRSAGVGKMETQFWDKPMEGRLGKATGIYTRGKLTSHKAWELRVEGEEKLERGLSGSPVLTDSDYCVAIASHAKDAGERGIAISVEGLFYIWQEIPDGIFDPAQPNVYSWLSETPTLRMDLEKEIDAFTQIVYGKDGKTKILIIHAPPGWGRTRLLKEYVQIAYHYELRFQQISLNQQISIEDFLRKIAHSLELNKFTAFQGFLQHPREVPITFDSEKERGRLLAEHFFTDLSQRNLPDRLVLFIHQYEKADKLLKEWLGQYFLPRVGYSSALIVVISGEEEAAPYLTENWVKRFGLQRSIFKYWQQYARRQCGSGLPPETIRNLFNECKGVPQHLVIAARCHKHALMTPTLVQTFQQVVGRYTKALADFDQAIALDDKNAWAFASRGETSS